MALAAHWHETVSLDVNTPPFERNPSSWRQRVPICLLAMVGALIAGYMALFQMGLISSVWDPIFGQGSERVLESRAAGTMDRWLHIPDAALGSWAYLSEAIFGLVGSTRRWQYRPWMVVLFGIDVIPLGLVSAILVVTQGFVVGSWCTLCLVSAAISLVLIALAYDEVWACLRYLVRIWTHHRDARLLVRVFCGFPSPEADALALKG